jgi:hypothetical protein
MKPDTEVESLALLHYIQETLGSNLKRRPVVLNEIFHGFLKFFLANTRIVPKKRP